MKRIPKAYWFGVPTVTVLYVAAFYFLMNRVTCTGFTGVPSFLQMTVAILAALLYNVPLWIGDAFTKQSATLPHPVLIVLFGVVWSIFLVWFPRGLVDAIRRTTQPEIEPY